MAITNQNTLVKFNYGAANSSTGMISFDAATQAIYVGDGSTANLVTSSVKDATFENSVLTITKVDGSVYTLDFSDVASASGVSMNFKTLDERVAAAKKVADDASTAATANTTAISNLATTVTKLDASYKEADTALDNRLKDVEAAVGEGGSVETQISNAIDALGGSAEDVDDSSFVKVAVTSENGEVKTVTVTTTDIAKASDLTAHTGNDDIHVTKTEKDRWTAAAEDVETFFRDASISEAAKDTLKEIQDYITSDATAASEMTASIKTAQDTADDAVEAAAAAQADVDAVEAALGTGFSSSSTVTAQLADVKATADAAAVKSATDTSLNLKADKSALATTDANLKVVTDSYVISFGGAKGAISVDTTNSTNGHVKFAMDGSTLKGSVNGLGSAAFTDSTAYDASGSANAAKTAAINAVTGTTSDASTVKTIEGTRKYAEALVAAVPAATVTGVDGANTSDEKGYVTIALELSNKSVAIKSVAVDTQAVASATESADGLATAYDVKSYVDGKDTAMDARMDVVEGQLKWNVIA